MVLLKCVLKVISSCPVICLVFFVSNRGKSVFLTVPQSAITGRIFLAKVFPVFSVGLFGASLKCLTLASQGELYLRVYQLVISKYVECHVRHSKIQSNTPSQANLLLVLCFSCTHSLIDLYNYTSI